MDYMPSYLTFANTATTKSAALVREKIFPDLSALGANYLVGIFGGNACEFAFLLRGSCTSEQVGPEQSDGHSGERFLA